MLVMITFLSAGAGTLPLVAGMRSILHDSEIAVIPGTADALWLPGGHVLREADAVLYLFAGLLNTATWQGIQGDSYATHRFLTAIGLPEALALGDRERAATIARADLLGAGMSLTAATELLAAGIGCGAAVLPVTDVPVQGMVRTGKGALPLALWREHPTAGDPEGFALEHPAPLAATAKACACIRASDAVIIGPCEPVSGIMPLLACTGIAGALASAYVIVISPFSGKHDGSGPEGALLRAEGYPATSESVREIVGTTADLFVQDTRDPAEVAGSLRLDTRMATKNRAESFAWDLMAIIRRASAQKRSW
ncbi:MAG: 2-phospho-L-lactate transferase [Methanomicrobiales archaeon]|nr:2-phospho-L-lactate transferase [Methanomicrobiales archaeon]